MRLIAVPVSCYYSPPPLEVFFNFILFLFVYVEKESAQVTKGDLELTPRFELVILWPQPPTQTHTPVPLFLTKRHQAPF